MRKPTQKEMESARRELDSFGNSAKRRRRKGNKCRRGHFNKARECHRAHLTAIANGEPRKRGTMR